MVAENIQGGRYGFSGGRAAAQKPPMENSALSLLMVLFYIFDLLLSS